MSIGCWRVSSRRRDVRVPIPINLDTVNKLYDLDADLGGGGGLVRGRAPSRSPRSAPRRMWSSPRSGANSTRSSSAAIPASNGALDPSELDKSVTARVPTRTNRDDRYFTDKFQAMPAARLHAHVREDARPSEHRRRCRRPITPRSATAIPHRRVDLHRADRRVFRLPLRQAALPLAALRARTLDQAEFQPVGTVNYPRPRMYTRITEYKHLTGQAARQDQHHLRISVGRGRPLLPDPAAGEPGIVQAVRGARRCDAGRVVRRPARDLPLLQHGPDRRPGACRPSGASTPACRLRQPMTTRMRCAGARRGISLSR